MTEPTQARPARLGRPGQLAGFLNAVAACLTAAIVLTFAEHLTSLDVPATARILIVVPLCLFAVSIAFALASRKAEEGPAQQVRMALALAGLSWIPIGGSLLAPHVLATLTLLTGGPVIAWMLFAARSRSSRRPRTQLLVVALALGGLFAWARSLLVVVAAVVAMFASPRWARRRGLEPEWAAPVVFAGIPISFLLVLTSLSAVVVTPVLAAFSASFLVRAGRASLRPRWIVACVTASLVLEVVLIVLFVVVAVGLGA